MKSKKIILLLIVSILMVGCGNLDAPTTTNQTEFTVNEVGIIDHYKVVLNDVIETKTYQGEKPENDTFLILEFKITNESREEQILTPDVNFKLMLNDGTYHDLGNTEITKVPSNDSIIYQVVYDVPDMDSYSVLFYSGVVSNNIRFNTK